MTQVQTSFKVRTYRLGEDRVGEQLIEAPDESAVRALLLKQGLTVLSVNSTTPSSPLAARTFFGMVRSTSVRRGRYALFCREVRTLVQAGMTVVEAVDTLGARRRIQASGDDLSDQLLQRLQQGQSLSVALAGLPEVPPVLIAAVRAGERTSNLVQALDDYLKYDALVENLRRKVISAAIYPALVTGLGLAISLFLVLVVMPNFARMYQNLRGSASGATALMIEFSQFLSQNQGSFLATVALALVLMVYWVQSGTARKNVLGLMQHLPWVRNQIQDFQLAMMYQALAMLLKGGYPMMEALQVAGQSALSASLKTALQSASDQVERGGQVAQALSNHQLCDEVGRRLMAAAERNGDFYLAADTVSRLHGERFELFVERMTRIVEPVLLLAVALMVGTIVVMMYLPVFDMATRLR